MTGGRLLIVIAIAVVTMSAGLLLFVEPLELAVLEVVRWTARTSLVLFALAYIARPATVLSPSAATKRLLRERKWVGDGFAVSHLVHLAAIITYAYMNWEAFRAGRNAATIVAAIVFVILFAMAITSIDRVREAMSRRAWNALHRAGMHLIWIVFVGTYVRRLGEPSSGVVPVIGLAALAVIAGIRAAAWVRTRGKARARASVAA